MSRHKLEWLEEIEDKLPVENGRLNHSLVVFERTAYNPPKLYVKRKYCSWTTLIEFINFLENNKPNGYKYARCESIVEKYVVRNLDRFGNCLIGKSFPISKEEYLSELASLGFPNIKVRKERELDKDKCLILEVVM